MNLKYILSGKKKYNLSNTVGGAGAGAGAEEGAEGSTAGTRVQTFPSLGSPPLPQQSIFRPPPVLYESYIQHVNRIAKERASNMTNIEENFMKTHLDNKVSYNMLTVYLMNAFNTKQFQDWFTYLPRLHDLNDRIDNFIRTKYAQNDQWNLICSHGIQIPSSYVIIPPKFKLQTSCHCGEVVADCVSNELKRKFFNNSRTRKELFSSNPLYEEYDILPDICIYFNSVNPNSKYMLTGIIHGDIDDQTYGHKMCLSSIPTLNYSHCNTTDECIEKSFHVHTSKSFNTDLEKNVYTHRGLNNTPSLPVLKSRLNNSHLLWGKKFTLHDILRLLNIHYHGLEQRYILYSCRNYPRDPHTPSIICRPKSDQYKKLIPDLETLINKMNIKLDSLTSHQMPEMSEIIKNLKDVSKYITNIITSLKRGQGITCEVPSDDFRPALGWPISIIPLSSPIFLAGSYKIDLKLILILVRFNEYITRLLQVTDPTNLTENDNYKKLINLINLELLETTNEHNDAIDAAATAAAAAPAAAAPAAAPAAAAPAAAVFGQPE